MAEAGESPLHVQSVDHADDCAAGDEPDSLDPPAHQDAEPPPPALR
jgi:hypothetical protein